MRRALAACIAAALYACVPAAPVARLYPDPWPRPLVSSAQVRQDIAGALERGDRRGVTLGLMNLSRMGAALSPETQARLAPLLDPSALPRDWRPASPLAEALAHNFRGNGRAVEESEPFGAVPARYRLIEGIAWDATRRRLFAGSVIDRRLLVRDGEEGTAEWRIVPLAAPAGGLFGMAVDEQRRLLWIASAAAEPMSEPETAFSGLIAIDLDRLAEERRLPVPGAHVGDVAIGPDGTVYASDGQSGAVYRCRPGCAEAETLVPPGLLPSPQGMVVWPGRGLYVADYALGLMLIDLRTLAIRPLVARAPQMLDGIDGLVRMGDYLVAIQNGTRPRRIARITLDRGGRRVDDVKTVEQNHREWGEPTLGAVVAGSTLAYVADAQWERYGRGGALTDGGAPRPTAIRRAWDIFDVILTLDRRRPRPPSLASRRARS